MGLELSRSCGASSLSPCSEHCEPALSLGRRDFIQASYSVKGLSWAKWSQVHSRTGCLLRQKSLSELDYLLHQDSQSVTSLTRWSQASFEQLKGSQILVCLFGWIFLRYWGLSLLPLRSRSESKDNFDQPLESVSSCFFSHISKFLFVQYRPGCPIVSPSRCPEN